MKKHKLHYIWQYYLRSWAKQEKKVHKIWAMVNDKIIFTNMENVAQERDFYQIRDLNIQDIDLIDNLILKKMSNELRKNNQTWVNLFNFIVNFRNQAMQNGITQELQEEFDNLIYNFEEEVQCEIEMNSKSYLDKIKSGDVSFYENEDDNINFNYFLSVQYFRTCKLKNSISDIKHPNINIDRIWNIAAHIFAINMGYKMNEEKGVLHCVIMKNNTEQFLITGDQPVVNTFSSYKDDKEQLSHEQFELYYPQSPILALLITKRPEFKDITTIEMETEMVRKYNDIINNASHIQLYSNTKESLEYYKKN